MWGSGRPLDPSPTPGVQVESPPSVQVAAHGRAGQASGETRHVPRPQELAQVGTLLSHLSPESSGDLGPFPATLHPEGTHTSYSQLRPVPAASPTALGGRWFSDGSSFSELSSAPGMGSRCGRPPLPALLRDPLGQPPGQERPCATPWSPVRHSPFLMTHRQDPAMVLLLKIPNTVSEFTPFLPKMRRVLRSQDPLHSSRMANPVTLGPGTSERASTTPEGTHTHSSGVRGPRRVFGRTE